MNCLWKICLWDLGINIFSLGLQVLKFQRIYKNKKNIKRDNKQKLVKLFL